MFSEGLPRWLMVKNTPANAGEAGSIPGSGRPPGERHGNPLEFSYLENPMDRGTWGATVHRVSRVGHNLSTKLQLTEFNLHVSLMSWPLLSQWIGVMLIFLKNQPSLHFKQVLRWAAYKWYPKLNKFHNKQGKWSQGETNGWAQQLCELVSEVLGEPGLKDSGRSCIGRGQSRISVHPDLLFNCLKGKETVLGFSYSSLPLAIAISGVCLEAQRRRLGLWFGPDSKQTSRQLGGLQHRGLFEKPVPSDCTLEAPEHPEVSQPRGGAHGPPRVPVLVPPWPALSPPTSWFTREPWSRNETCNRDLELE